MRFTILFAVACTAACHPASLHDRFAAYGNKLASVLPVHVDGHAIENAAAAAASSQLVAQAAARVPVVATIDGAAPSDDAAQADETQPQADDAEPQPPVTDVAPRGRPALAMPNVQHAGVARPSFFGLQSKGTCRRFTTLAQCTAQCSALARSGITCSCLQDAPGC